MTMTAAERAGTRPAVQALIDDGQPGASVTIALVGSETYARPWCIYEVAKSRADGKGPLGIRIHNVKNQYEQTVIAGPDPFAFVETQGVLGLPATLSGRYPLDDWILDDGSANVDTWIETAAKAAGR